MPKLTHRLYNDNCLDVMPTIKPDKVDTIICDPPYGLKFMGKEWDHGIPGVPFWEAALRIAKPGAFLLAFGGTRTFHRLACAIEDAGWEIRDCVMWVYGSGFPKSHSIGKAIDKVNGETGRLLKFTQWMRTTGLRAGKVTDALRNAGAITKNGTMAGHFFAKEVAGQPAIPTVALWQIIRPLCDDVPAWVDELVDRIEAEREVVGRQTGAQSESTGRYGAWGNDDGTGKSDFNRTAPATPAAQLWEGYGTALKPAWEIILCAQKPLRKDSLRGRIVGNLLQLEAQLWSLLPASVAAERFKLSRAGYDEVCDFAQWSVGERSSTRDALCDQTDMSQFVTATISSLSIVSSWRSILDGGSEVMSTSITETESRTTIDWKTLKSCVLALTPRSIIEAAIHQPGSWWNALPAARFLNAACVNIDSTRELSALGSAISSELGKCQERIDLGLRPDWEPVIVAMKPLAGTYAANALEHGVAGINVDGCRVGTDDKLGGGMVSKGRPCVSEGWDRPWMHDPKVTEAKKKESAAKVEHAQNLGRWPANLIWSHVPDTDCPACSGDYPACRLCGGTGVIKGCVRRGTKRVGSGGRKDGVVRKRKGHKLNECVGAANSPDSYGTETVEDWDCHPDCPSRAFPSPHGAGHSKSNDCATSRGSWFTAEQAQEAHNGMRFGDSGSAARFFKCCNYGEADRLFYCAKASKRERTMNGLVPNSHPTVKPLSLMEYLCKLTMTPTGGIVLDPFMGSGSTGVACAMTGRQFIGIENDTEHGYFKVAQERIREAYRENPL